MVILVWFDVVLILISSFLYGSYIRLDIVTSLFAFV